MQTGLTIQFRPSWQLACFYTVLALLTVIGIFTVPIPLWLRSLLSLLALVPIVYVLRQHAFLSLPTSVMTLIYQPKSPVKQHWIIVTKAGISYPVTLSLQDCFVTPYLTVLNVTKQKQSKTDSWLTRFPPLQSIILLPDRLSDNEYRRLRVVLNWANPFEEGDPV